MALEKEFLLMCSTTITVEPLSTMNSYGAQQYSTTSFTYPAYIEYARRKITTAQGKEEVSNATVYVMSSSASISEYDRVTLPLSTNARLLRVETLTDEQGQHHLELAIG